MTCISRVPHPYAHFADGWDDEQPRPIPLSSTPIKSFGRILSRGPALPPSEFPKTWPRPQVNLRVPFSLQPCEQARKSFVRPFRKSREFPRPQRVSARPIRFSFAIPVSSCPKWVSRSILVSFARSESRVRSSLPSILLSSLEDLSSVAENLHTKSRSCNSKISVQNSSLLCLTPSAFCTIS